MVEKNTDAAPLEQAVAEVRAESQPQTQPPAEQSKQGDEAPKQDDGVSVRFYAESKKLQPWQVAALLPHVRVRVAELELAPLHDETGRVLPVAELDALVEHALNGRV